MKNWDLAFTGSWPAWLILLSAAGAALLAYLFYRRRCGALPQKKFWMLTGLRAFLILLVALFLLKPVIRFTRSELAEAQAAVLLDVSASMSIRDATGGESRLDAARELLTGSGYDILGELRDSHGVRVYTFGEVTSEMAEDAKLAELQADHRATSVGAALKAVSRQTSAGSLSGIVVLTDGVSTFGQDARDVAEFLGGPVFPVALGGKMAQRGKFRDVGIAGAPHNLELIVDNTATIECTLTASGLDEYTESERRLPLKLTNGNRTLATTQVQFPARVDTLRVELEYVPKEVGIHRLKLSLPELPDETLTENNAREFNVRVTDPRMKVLMVEGVVRSEYRFLRRTLESDPNIELTAMIKLRKDRFLLQGADPGLDLSRGLPARREDFGHFDVVILGDVGRDEFSGIQLEYLRDYVDGGGSLMVLGGYHSFGAGGYAGSPLAEVLPVEMGGDTDGHVEEPFSPKLTLDGRQHPVFEGCVEYFTGESSPIKLDGANEVTGRKPGASVLAVHPDRTVDGEPMPVVAAQPYGGGKVEVLTADTTWKWKFQVEAQGQDSPYYKFWRQSVRWLAGRRSREPEGDQLVAAWTDKMEYERSEEVLLKAKVRNQSKEPEDAASVVVELDYPVPVPCKDEHGETTLEKRAEIVMQKVPLSPGEYQAPFTPEVGGIYKGTVRASLDGVELGQGRVEFVVGRAASEFDRVDVDEMLLRSVAGSTGGRYHTMITAEEIPQELENRRRKISYHEERNLWNAPEFFLLFLCCATLEWVLRKRSALN